jgi:hypothetical protein
MFGNLRQSQVGAGLMVIGLSCNVIGIGNCAKLHYCMVALIPLQKWEEAGVAVYGNGKHPPRHRIKGACVPDPFVVQYFSQAGNAVMGGQSQGLI